MPIPVIDLFAGPGGLGEGFSSFQKDEKPVFQIKLSVEKDEAAHKTLELRAFFREFRYDNVPDEYYEYLRGDISRQNLFEAFPIEGEKAKKEAWNTELGNEKKAPHELVKTRIREALGGRINWVLIGGPPCQAYSLVGRSKMIGEIGREKFEGDHRHFLYRQYLRIIADHRPPVFIMENVKGLLSATVCDEKTFEKIRTDLTNPVKAVAGRSDGLSYKLVSLVALPSDLLGDYRPEDFVVHAEDYGIPQARHRVILMGIRSDCWKNTKLLQKQPNQCLIEDVLGDLPRLRSGLSKETDDPELWRNVLTSIPRSEWFKGPPLDDDFRRDCRRLLNEIQSDLTRGGMFIAATQRKVKNHFEWFNDVRLKGVCNHETRSHIREDLHRYFFVAMYARVHGRSPLLNDFPVNLLPDHKNVEEALKTTKFNDRFRVQREGRPSTTVTSHISKDGHYFVHYDPTQCRSLTVREAARLQTFPDNYFFEGPRTQQYHQVGNAVPPLLAKQIAEIVSELF
jgi:DNA (cytosine-5)-methyltransferase 1